LGLTPPRGPFFGDLLTGGLEKAVRTTRTLQIGRGDQGSRERKTTTRSCQEKIYMSVALETTFLAPSDGFPSQAGNVRTGAAVDLRAIEKAVRAILVAVGEDPDRPGLIDTPRRVARMYREMFSGLHADPARHLRVTFPEQYDEMVLVRDISFTSMCEHHLLPFSGQAHVAYIPSGRVTGLSKLARVVDEVARRPQVQERMTSEIADLIEQQLESSGVAVVVSAEHSCMSIRGIRKPGSRTITSALRGIFKTNESSRAEVMALINQG
jgi:GTP cyclohydrolase I